MKRGSKVFWSSSSAVSKRREVHNARRNYVTLINPPFSLLPLGSPLPLLVPASLTPCRHPRRSDSRQALLIPQMVPMKRKWVTLFPFAKDFTVNLRVSVAFRVPRSRADPEIHCEIQQSCSISFPRAWEGRDGTAPATKNSLFSPPSNLPTIRVTRARFPSIDAQSRAYPTSASLPLLRLPHPTGYPNKIVTQTFTLFERPP
jgi:hypothetical protein